MASARVLISDVDRDIRRLLVSLVERFGHHAVVLEEDIIVPPRADLLLVDPNSRGGVEHARLVRAFFPELPVVCLSRLPEHAGFLGRGRTIFLPQPFAPEALQWALGEALARDVSPV